MWIYKPTGEIFKNRLDAKLKLGHSFCNGAIKYGDLIFTNDTTLAYDEYTISTNSEKHS